ncbi:acidic leucine-rich nuclear phosphoprotein 32 family member A [Tanacetum coccineum]
MLTDREFHQNNQYILATQATQVFYLEDLARRPLHWKVVEHVYHRDMAESDQDVIHDSSSSHVTLSIGLTCLEHTDLSINAQSTQVDAPPVNDDNANANQDNADFINNEDDVVAHVLDKQDKVVVDNVYTVGERVRLGLKLKLRLLWSKNNNRIKADHYAKRTSPNEAKNHPPPPKVWGDRTQDDWNELVDWWSQPDRVSRSLQNAANRAKNTIITHQGKKSFAQGRNEYKVDKGYYEDLIETWRKGHSNKKTGQFKTTENEQRYLDMKAMQDNVKAGLIPFKTDQEILDEIVPSDNRQNMSGMGRKLPGGGSTSRRRANRAFGDIMTRDQITQMFRQQEQEKELHRKQAEEAQARAYLASLKADAADQRANVAQQNSEANNAALDLARENNNESSSGEEEEAEQHTGGDDDYSDEDE